MLAFPTKESKVAYPLFIQPKYNGVRGLYMPEHKTLQSRDEILYDPSTIQHLLTVLTKFNFVTDGELYKHGLSLQQINSRVGVNRRKPHDKVAEIQYYIFDVPTMQPMWERVAILEKIRKYVEPWPIIQVAPTHLVTSQMEADYYYGHWKSQGYEGLIYREYDAPYGFQHLCGNKENRWWRLQKRKEALDLEAVILEVYEGEDGFKGMLGGFQCVMDNGTIFNVGGGLDIAQRQDYWQNPDKCIGATLRIKYEMLSDGGIPLKPIIEFVDELY